MSDKLEDVVDSIYWFVEHGQIRNAVRVLSKLQRDAASLDAMPGVWECPQCGFVLTKSILHAQDGGISANTEPFNEICPNDGKLMQPLTYKNAYRGLLKSCESQIKRAVAAEEKLEIAINQSECSCEPPNADGHFDYCQRYMKRRQIEEVFAARERRCAPINRPTP